MIQDHIRSILFILSSFQMAFGVGDKMIGKPRRLRQTIAYSALKHYLFGSVEIDLMSDAHENRFHAIPGTEDRADDFIPVLEQRSRSALTGRLIIFAN